MLLSLTSMKQVITIILVITILGCTSNAKNNSLKKIKPECVNDLGITNLNLDFNKWDSIKPVESFYYFEEKIFDAWGTNEENCLSDELLNVIYVCNMSVQIDNGGIVSFVDNGSGDYFNQTLLALNEIGLDKHYKILKEFQTLFPENNVPVDMNVRRYLMDSLLEANGDSQETFETWDKTIYSSKDYLINKIIHYLKKYSVDTIKKPKPEQASNLKD